MESVIVCSHLRHWSFDTSLHLPHPPARESVSTPVKVLLGMTYPKVVIPQVGYLSFQLNFPRVREVLNVPIRVLPWMTHPNIVSLRTSCLSHILIKQILYNIRVFDLTGKESLSNTALEELPHVSCELMNAMTTPRSSQVTQHRGDYLVHKSSHQVENNLFMLSLKDAAFAPTSKDTHKISSSGRVASRLRG